MSDYREDGIITGEAGGKCLNTITAEEDPNYYEEVVLGSVGRDTKRAKPDEMPVDLTTHIYEDIE